ncbi:hypothetical protein U8V97_22160, partial [Priestia filamentosa]|uniref:hypothetical protein n=1 Tax=Priestia filamentosa TaxID=1402861 RepID=UPI00397991D5
HQLLRTIIYLSRVVCSKDEVISIYLQKIYEISCYIKGRTSPFKKGGMVRNPHKTGSITDIEVFIRNSNG